tara:strand:+ start:1184 stop:1444 length:261 start_codon:yes stop_codon:yes gene_type:complete
MPFKSDKQRGWMFANKPSMASRWVSEKADGGEVLTPGIIKASIKNSMKDMRQFSANRAKGRIGNGSKMPSKCVSNQQLAMKKFKEN